MQQENNENIRSISRHQVGTLKFINENHVTLDYLRHAHGTTLGSVLYWKWIALRKAGNKTLVVLTEAGRAQLRAYERASLNERNHEAEITERCMRLLKHVRSAHVISLRSRPDAKAPVRASA